MIGILINSAIFASTAASPITPRESVHAQTFGKNSAITNAYSMKQRWNVASPFSAILSSANSLFSLYST
eukprot:CAMPEP_0197070538 /NCGR_PEP_ID=MMETSP1384-20130603/200878_1 /TAXON_ID=29189 /ORGANISM="Ammonia sp." /LENGTH=68 /DNA_ID=CAMNT_0042508957 /DNA_START=134 /DNA_END=340 /DNA_ORIENTATION=+